LNDIATVPGVVPVRALPAILKSVLLARAAAVKSCTTSSPSPDVEDGWRSMEHIPALGKEFVAGQYMCPCHRPSAQATEGGTLVGLLDCVMVTVYAAKSSGSSSRGWFRILVASMPCASLLSS
jgi:hypothetical protein